MNSEKKSSPLTTILIFVGIILIAGLFVLGLNTERDSFKDENDVARETWEDFMVGEWGFTNAQDAEELIGFNDFMIYARLLADLQFQHLRSEGTWQVRSFSEEGLTLELTPDNPDVAVEMLTLTKVDDGQMTGRFSSMTDEDADLMFDRRR